MKSMGDLPLCVDGFLSLAWGFSIASLLCTVPFGSSRPWQSDADLTNLFGAEKTHDCCFMFCVD